MRKERKRSRNFLSPALIKHQDPFVLFATHEPRSGLTVNTVHRRTVVQWRSSRGRTFTIIIDRFTWKRPTLCNLLKSVKVGIAQFSRRRKFRLFTHFLDHQRRREGSSNIAPLSVRMSLCSLRRDRTIRLLLTHWSVLLPLSLHRSAGVLTPGFSNCGTDNP